MYSPIIHGYVRCNGGKALCEADDGDHGIDYGLNVSS